MKKEIDVDSLFKKHAPKAYKAVPRFVIKYIEKIVHQDDMNNFLHQRPGKEGQELLKEGLVYFGPKIKYFGNENVDINKKYVFASNHPLGGLDGLSLLNIIHYFFGEAKAIVNELLLYIEGLKPVFTGVNVFGKFTRNQIREIDELYRSEKQVVVFPSGEVSRKIKGKIKDQQWQKSFLTKAIEHKRDIVPVYTIARNSNHFYNVAGIRKFFGIKANIELFLLPSELFKFKGKEIKIVFGKPIPYDTFDNSKNISEWVSFIKNESDKLCIENLEFKDFTPTSENLLKNKKIIQ